jgi:type II secretory pathway pseudopilin PulG
MKELKGISLIALIITIIVIIILAAIVIGVALNTPESANRAKFASDMSEVQHAVKVKLADNYNQFITNPDNVDLNNGFTRLTVNSAPESFDSFPLEGTETGTIGYLVRLDTIKMDQLTIGQEYKTATEVTFGATDAFVYDAEGEVFYALGYKYQDKVYYSIADLEVGREAIIPSEEPEEEPVEVDYANAPDLTNLPNASTYAITYDGSNNPVTMALAQAKTDTSWYDYRSSVKKWANIKTTNGGNDAYWVWIPRYAYKIDSPNTTTSQTINIKFLSGTSNTPADGTQLPADYVVHPAFTFGGVELSGIWVAKFEASSTNPTKVEGAYYTGGGNDTALQVRVLPNVYSWRNIHTGNAQTVCMNMVNSGGSIGTTTNLDTHQIKNTEWGAVAYLTQSVYGKNSEVWINPYGETTTYKMKTGYTGGSADSVNLPEGNASLVQYNTGNGLNASTTGNIYGVYDMAGGAWEFVAGYIDNGNSNLGTYGISTYFSSNILKAQYSKYYDAYEPGNQEKSGGIYYGTGISTIWNADNSVANNTIRKSLTDATYAKMTSKKGDAMYETTNGVSYYGKDNTNAYTWLKNATDTSANRATGWNNDYQFYGHGSIPWFARGGFISGSTAGMFSVNTSTGNAYMDRGFRPVLVAGTSL